MRAPELTPAELDLLARIRDKVELQPFFFRKAKGTKWFDFLEKEGYFEPSRNPIPTASKDEGYVNVSAWPVADYLVNASEELYLDATGIYANKFLEVIRRATDFAISKKFSNYRTWWQFSKIVQQIPVTAFEDADSRLFEYWLNDPYERSLIGRELGEKWLPKLLEASDAASRKLGLRILAIVFQIEQEPQTKNGKRNKPVLKVRPYDAEQIAEKVAAKAGQYIGQDAVDVFRLALEAGLNQSDNDSWSSIWRPAIGTHDQNRKSSDGLDVLVEATRDALVAFVVADQLNASEYVRQMVGSKYFTLQRIALYAIDKNFARLEKLLPEVLKEHFWGSNFRHEMWHLLNRNYGKFSPTDQSLVLSITELFGEKEKSEELSSGAIAYRKSIWLAAIKDHGAKEADLYRKSVEEAGTKPEHPDFSSFTTVGWVDHKSPIPLEELLPLSCQELAVRLNSYINEERTQPRGFNEPGIEGLQKIFRQLIKTDPIRFYSEVGCFIGSRVELLFEILEAFRELWQEKASLPWDSLWVEQIEFCKELAFQDEFWHLKNSDAQVGLRPTHSWLISSMAKLIEAGTRSDEHAFDEALLPGAKNLIVRLISMQVPEDIDPKSDAIFHAINSSRGQCIEALINLSLRQCRLADKRQKNHEAVWATFEPLYDSELKKSGSNGCEFAALLVNYLPNFLYLSNTWVISNLKLIFDQTDYKKWACAMQGYVYVNAVHEPIYRHLKTNGDFLRALDDADLMDKVQERVIQNIAVAYLEDFESITNSSSLIRVLVERKNESELSQLVWFLWTHRDGKDQKTSEKVFQLWPLLLTAVNSDTREGKKFLSKLSTWSAFVDQITPEKKQLLLGVAEFAEYDYHAYQLLESLAKISKNQPLEVAEVWMKMLTSSSPDFPEEAIITILSNLRAQGAEGHRTARAIADKYIKSGNDRVSILLQGLV